MIIRESKKHLVDAKRQYVDHAKFAIMGGNKLLKAAVISYIHALIPAAYPFRAELEIKKIYKIVKDLEQWRKEQ